jgi:hypothetical protein
VVIAIPTPEDRESAEGVADTMSEMAHVLVAVGGPGARDVQVPASVVRLPDDIPNAAAALEQALVGRRD